jgi:hypothetical protein
LFIQAAANCIVVANAAFSVVAATPSILTPLGQVRVARDIANDEKLDNTRTSDEMSQTDRHTPGFPPRRSAKVHITKALSSLADSLTVRRRFFQHIVRDLGEHDAILLARQRKGGVRWVAQNSRNTQTSTPT